MDSTARSTPSFSARLELILLTHSSDIQPLYIQLPILNLTLACCDVPGLSRIFTKVQAHLQRSDCFTSTEGVLDGRHGLCFEALA